MELKVSSGGIGSPKRDVFRSSRNRNQKTMMSNLMEAIAEMNSGGGGGVISETKEDGVVRMKVKVRKEDLRQMLEMMKSGNKTSTNNNTSYSSSSTSSLSVEQRLNLLRRKHILRGNNIIAGNNGSPRGCRSWSPVLQSIPEEL